MRPRTERWLGGSARVGKLSRHNHSDHYERYGLARWLEHIQVQHWRSIDMSLARVSEVWEKLREPSIKPLYIAVAGTNGKGSSVAMLDAVLRHAGCRAGSFTSPHLIRYNERVRVDGTWVSDEELCRAFSQIERARADIPLTYFEFSTLCALLIFQSRRVRVAILEVGMGGRLDAVNLIANDIALITSIGIDHTQWLGDSREAIATEKAGIFKPGGLAVCADLSPPDCVGEIAATRNCHLFQSGAHYQVRQSQHRVHWRSDAAEIPPAWRCLEDLQTPLPGAQQLHNLGGVVAVLALTAARTGVTPDHLKTGLSHTQLAGRCQILPATLRRPEIILDVAHNLDATAELADFLRRRPKVRHTYAVFGVLCDKPSREILAHMAPRISHWHLASLDGERGQRAKSLDAQLAEITTAHAAALHDSPQAAAQAALAAATPTDRVVIFGSFQLLGPIMADWEGGFCGEK